MRTFSTLDAHVSGEGVRLLVDGAPSVSGRTLQDKLVWMRRHADGLRRTLMLEPRGHAGMQGVMLTEPASPNPSTPGRAHAGLIFMNASGFTAFSGEGVVAAVTLALDHKILHAESDELIFDTPVGMIRARPRFNGAGSVESVAVTGVPSFVLSAGLPLQIGSKSLRVDIAFGGEFYAIVDSESIGVPADAAHFPQLARAAREIQEAMKGPKPLDGAVFTGPPAGSADLRSVTVLAGGILKRSPGVAGTFAMMTVLDAMGLLPEGQSFTHEGVLGTTLRGRILSRQDAREGEPAMVVPMVEARAWYTGRHDFEVADADPNPALEI